MIFKLLKQLKNESPQVGVDELQLVHDEIEAKQKRIAEEKAKIQEEHHDGSRLTKHRFTI
ncbi:hypothetical protein ACSR9J_01090 [Citrobacter koseri]|uniref:hypothetical protein n=1 Tax=Citrobacter TaxID=544 RepID=UPI002576CC86|nr:hypothetical protein [Citrobacter sp. CK196]MDM2986865.1 hypothetical protein [Citrobacter sp. CK196]HAV2295739.1 hypothetical protein [Citrobacter koseri]